MKIGDRNRHAYKCTNCGRVTYPKRVACLGCHGRDFQKIQFGEDCELLTFSRIYQLPWGVDERRLTIGVCRFDNGVKAMGRISTYDVALGMKMKAKWKKFRQIAGEDVWGWEFEPAG